MTVPPRYRHFRWLLRPSLWTCIIAIIAYWDKEALHGTYVYDDAGSVKNNVVVTGAVPWTEALTRDFWGTPMVEKQSHKSFRPITTLSFRLNWILSEKLGTNGTDSHTYGFHVVNVCLHGIVTGLVTESAAWVFDLLPAQQGGDVVTPVLLTGILFALHPVHAEVVSNMTSRGELLMSLFSLLAFLSFVNFVPATTTTPESSSSSSRIRTVIFVYIVPWLCMTLSLFCKEQGASTLITLVIFDFVKNHSSVRSYLVKLWQRDEYSLAFLGRTCILAVQTLIIVIWRYWLNGESSPDFIYDQNPAGFSEDRFTRVFSVNWVYCLYIWDAIYPRFLCPDWSGQSIDLITQIYDPRIVYVLALWCFAAGCVVSLITGNSFFGESSKTQQGISQVVIVACLAFTFSPFLLSSNLLVVVGLMKADRVIYLPLMGFCLLEALLFQMVFNQSDDKEGTKSLKDSAVVQRPSPPYSTVDIYYLPGTRTHCFGYIVVLIQLFLFSAKVHERNVAWSHPLNLWRLSYEINPRSHHTQYNCGYELSLKKRYQEAEQVLRPIGDPHVEGPSNTFVYAMVLYNLDRCEESLDFIEEALYVVEEKRKQGGIRNSGEKLRRSESNLLVAKAFCTKDTVAAGKIMYDAVQADPTNSYAIDQATEMVKRVQAIQDMIQYRMKMGAY